MDGEEGRSKKVERETSITQENNKGNYPSNIF
jgi:hypothetical protein